MSSVAAIGSIRSTPPAVDRAARSERTHRTLLVGTGPRAAEVAKTLLSDRDREIMGVVDVTRLPEFGDAMPSVPWLGSLLDIRAIALAHRIDEICVALPLRSGFDEWRHAEAVGRDLGIPVSFHFDLIGDGSRIHVSASGNARWLRVNLHPASLGAAPWLKRAFDVVVASLALLLFSPVLLMATLLVKSTSRGPALFKQPRVGRARRSFNMLKFRTMVVDAEQRRIELERLNDANGILFKIERDPRLTPVGAFLRRTSIDELPQLFNVLRGEMSLVGPRPLPTWACERLEDASFIRRYAVLPGMTGLWQIHGRPQDFHLMSKHDLRYVERWSLLLDVSILVRTIPAVLKRQGAQ